MNVRATIPAVGAAVAVMVSASWAGAQAARTADPSAPLDLPSIPVSGLAARLAALRPEKPLEYFHLAEEVAAERDTTADTGQAGALAQQLYGLSLALTLAPAQAAPAAASARDELTSSICLGLAWLARSQAERRWLTALAGVQTAGPAEPTTLNDAGLLGTPAAFDAATALGFVRSGEGRRAERLLDNPAVAEVLERYDALLSPIGMRGELAVVRRQMTDWPSCPECRNKRVVQAAGPDPAVLVCPICDGNPGPTLTEQQFLAHLRMESVLLSGSQRSWSAQLAVDGGAPLRELDLTEVPVVYGVSADRPLWRSGQWVAAPQSPAPAPAPAPASEPQRPAPPK